MQSKKRRIDVVEGLYDNFDTKEGQKDIYRIAAAAARDRAEKDIGQVSTINIY